MRRIVAALVVLAACKQDASQTTVQGTAAMTAPPPSPFTGALTGERVMGAKGLAHPFEKWEDAQSRLEAQMGKATYVKDQKTYAWGVLQGDDCWYVEVAKQADGTVGMVMEPMKISKGGALFNWGDCLKAAGARKDLIEDPNAPSPPGDGKAISVLDLSHGAQKARSKWNKAKVTVKGLYLSTSTGTANGVESATVSLTAAKGDLKNTLSCSLADPKAAPSTMTQYAAITVVGTVDISDMMTGAGDSYVGVGLKDCSLVTR